MKLCVVTLHMAEIVWCGTVIGPYLTFCVMMRAAWQMLCSLFMWRMVLMPASSTRNGQLIALHYMNEHEVELANGKTWDELLGTSRVSILRPPDDSLQAQKEGDESCVMEDERQPGLLEEDRLDLFIDELVDRVRSLRSRDVRVARDLVWVVGTHVRRGLTSRLPSLRRASERVQHVQEAWFAAMRHLQNVHTNDNGEWVWNWWARLRVACRAASRRYKRRRLMNQLVEDPSDMDPARDVDRLPQEGEQGMDSLSDEDPGDSPEPLQNALSDDDEEPGNNLEPLQNGAPSSPEGFSLDEVAIENMEAAEDDEVGTALPGGAVDTTSEEAASPSRESSKGPWVAKCLKMIYMEAQIRNYRYILNYRYNKMTARAQRNIMMEEMIREVHLSERRVKNARYNMEATIRALPFHTETGKTLRMVKTKVME